MQQTQTYKLNLIEPSDTFSPEALNANTRKVEDVLLAHQAKVDGQAAALDQRLTVLEGRKFAFGVYRATDNMADHCFVPLPFTPKAVLVNSGAVGNRTVNSLVTEGYVSPNLKLVENGFTVHYELNYGEFNFIAFG